MSSLYLSHKNPATNTTNDPSPAAPVQLGRSQSLRKGTSSLPAAAAPVATLGGASEDEVVGTVSVCVRVRVPDVRTLGLDTTVGVIWTWDVTMTMLGPGPGVGDDDSDDPGGGGLGPIVEEGAGEPGDGVEIPVTTELPGGEAEELVGTGGGDVEDVGDVVFPYGGATADDDEEDEEPPPPAVTVVAVPVPIGVATPPSLMV